jgi:hypothetical protein
MPGFVHKSSIHKLQQNKQNVDKHKIHKQQNIQDGLFKNVWSYRNGVGQWKLLILHFDCKRNLLNINSYTNYLK